MVGTAAISYLRSRLWSVRSELGADLVIANGENASDIHGLSAADAEALLDCGIDLLTMGNHTYGRRDLYGFLDNDRRIIRPANFPPAAPGQGYVTVDVCGWRVLVINVQGQVFMEPLADPFDTVERILAREKGDYDFAVMDIHAEATGEKVAIGYAYDGRIHVIFGTHTHVPTADMTVLPHGTGYVTDVGMCGESGGVLGMDAEGVVQRMRTRLPVKFTPASGAPQADGVIFTVDPSTGRTTDICRIRF